MMRQFFFALLLCSMMVHGAYATDRLCPDAAELAAQIPSDMAGVQADIDRIKLCVERARLLQQLDDIARQRRDILQKYVMPDNGMAMSSNSIPFPVLPAGSLPPLEIPQGQMPQQAAPTISAKPTWYIRKIWGQDNEMHAQLIGNGDVLLNVARGDSLPDGRVVEGLSVRGVTVSQNGKISDLDWEQNGAALPLQQ